MFLDRLTNNQDQMSAKDHGSSLISRGLIWFGVWFVTVLFLNLTLLAIINNMSRTTGPNGEQLLDITFAMVVGIALVGNVVLLVAVCVGGYAFLMIAVGIFERCSGVFFQSLIDRLSNLEFKKKILLYPLAFVAIVLPFLLAGIILVVAGPVPVMAAGYSLFDTLLGWEIIELSS